MSAQTAVVILAGGQATRLPGKLELDAGGIPLVVRVFRNVRDTGPVLVSSSRSFSRNIEMLLDCSVVIDRRPGRGPLEGLFTAFGFARAPRVFVVAADAPFVTVKTAAELASFWDADTQAVVPVNPQGRLEPLCALYDRAAFLDAAGAVLAEGSGGVVTAVERVRARRVRLSDELVFANVNTAADRRTLLDV